MQRPLFVVGVFHIVNCIGRRKSNEAAGLCVLLLRASVFPLALLVFYQPLTQGCRQQSWQHVCVECTVAIYGHALTVNKDRWILHV